MKNIFWTTALVAVIQGGAPKSDAHARVDLTVPTPANCVRTEPMPVARMDSTEVARYRMPVQRIDSATVARYRMPTLKLVACYQLDSTKRVPDLLLP